MKMKDVPTEFNEAIEGLRHGSPNVEAYVTESIEQAKNWEEAQGSIAAYMNSLISEAEGILTDLCGKEEVILEGWCIADIIELAEQHELPITDEWAKEVLTMAARKMDASIGINWDVLEVHLRQVVEDKESEENTKVEETLEKELPLLIEDLKLGETTTLNGKEAADALTEQSSDPEFFQLDENGEDING